MRKGRRSGGRRVDRKVARYRAMKIVVRRKIARTMKKERNEAEVGRTDML